MMKVNKKFLLRLIGPLALMLIIIFGIDIEQLINILQKFHPNIFFLGLILSAVLLYVRSLRWQLILRKMNIPYTIWRCFRIYYVEMVAVSLVATLGTLIKATYLKRDGYSLGNSLMSVVCDKYYDYMLPLIFGAISLLLMALKIESSISVVIIFGITLLIYPFARNSVILFHKIVPRRAENFFSKKGLSIEKHVYETKEFLNLTNYVISILGFVVWFLIVYFLARSLDVFLSFSHVVLIMSVTTLVTTIPISLFGIGTRDLGLLASFKWFGYLPEEAVALSSALLLLRVIIVFIGAIFWLTDPPLLSKLKEYQNTSCPQEDECEQNESEIFGNA